jgi:hypothetical protein
LSADRAKREACARTTAFRVQLWERRPWRRGAGCRSVRFRDGLRHLRVAAEISTGDRQVAADRSDELDRAQPRGAFLAERRDDSGKGRIGPDELGIFDRSVARLPDVVRPARPQDSLPLGAAPEAKRVSELYRRALLLASPRSDVKSDVPLPRALQPELPQGAPELQSAKQPQVLLRVPWELATESPETQASHEVLQVPPARLVSRARQSAQLLEPQRVAQSSLWPPQLWPLPRQLPPRPGQENVFAPAPRARYQSSSSASSFP